MEQMLEQQTIFKYKKTCFNCKTSNLRILEIIYPFYMYVNDHQRTEGFHQPNLHVCVHQNGT